MTTASIVAPLRRTCGCKGRASLRRRAVSLLLLLLPFLVFAGGCSGYASQAGKYLTEARSQVLGCAYTLERFRDGEVSDPFLRASLEQYAIAMKSTVQSISSLKAPPGAREEHQRQLEAISRARSLVQRAGQRGIDPHRALELVRELKRSARELRL